MALLLLQGPMGSFFKHLGLELARAGYDVRKINFNGGDRFFYGSSLPVDDYCGTPQTWYGYLKHYLRRHQISSIFVYGDCRHYHKVAKQLAAELNLEFIVFEEGYLRPHFITMEFGGANANSQLKLSPGILNSTIVPEQPKVEPTGYRLRNWAWPAIVYYWAAKIAYPTFHNYLHHRDSSPIREGWCWVKSGFRKLKYKASDKKLQQYLVKQHYKNFFLVPLQVHNDAQLEHHSNFESMEDFIESTITSFATYANKKHLLVFKHHPMDRGHKNYRKLIQEVAQNLNISGRVHYGFELHLPTLLDSALGCITINSTVGISAVLHSCPTICCGKAMYDIAGLTAQMDLGRFWSDFDTPDPLLFKKFQNYIRYKTQINGSFYINNENTAQLCCQAFIEQSRIDTAVLLDIPATQAA